MTIQPLHAMSYRVTTTADGHSIPVVNISVSGLALARPALPQWPAPGAFLSGELRIAEATYPLSLRLVHRSGDVVGCAFKHASPSVVQAIETRLEAELEAAEMEYVGPALLAPQPDGTPHWHHGRNNSALYYVECLGAIQRFRLMFLANYLEGGAARPVRFGVVVRDRRLDEDAAGAVRWLEMLAAEQLTATLRFLTSIPALDPAHRDAILRLIC